MIKLGKVSEDTKAGVQKQASIENLQTGQPLTPV
jgi:hypothetical protein